MQLIIPAIIIAAVSLFIFFAIKKALPKQSLFKETMHMIKDIMKEPDDIENLDENENSE